MHDYQAPRTRDQVTVNLAEIFLQQSARLIESQAAAARAIARAQARSFAALGGPDWSLLYGDENERQFSQFLKTSTEQAVSFVRESNDAVRRFQEAVNQLISWQAGQMTAQIRTSMDDMGRRAEQSISETRMTAEQAADVVQQAVASGLEGGAPSKRYA